MEARHRATTPALVLERARCGGCHISRCIGGTNGIAIQLPLHAGDVHTVIGDQRGVAGGAARRERHHGSRGLVGLPADDEATGFAGCDGGGLMLLITGGVVSGADGPPNVASA